MLLSQAVENGIKPRKTQLIALIVQLGAAEPSCSIKCQQTKHVCSPWRQITYFKRNGRFYRVICSAVSSCNHRYHKPVHFKHKETDFDRTNPGSSVTLYNKQRFCNLGGVSVVFSCGNTEDLSWALVWCHGFFDSVSGTSSNTCWRATGIRTHVAAPTP